MGFENLSMGITTGVGGLVITLTILFPFFVMSIIAIHYKTLKKPSFEKKYGSVTEGLKIHDYTSREVYQAHFYSVFLM